MSQNIFPLAAPYVRAHNKSFSRFVKSLFGNSIVIKQKLYSSLSPVHEVIGQLRVLLGTSLGSFP